MGCIQEPEEFFAVGCIPMADNHSLCNYDN